MTQTQLVGFSPPMPLDIAPTCGNCRFGQKAAVNVIRCHGLPPTPSVLAVTPDPLGRPQMQVEMLRPQLAANEPGCALHQPHRALDLGSRKMEGVA